jgi:hypothetical protein
MNCETLVRLPQDSEMLSLDFHLHIGLPRLALVPADLVSSRLVWSKESAAVLSPAKALKVNSIFHRVGATRRPHTTLMKAGICGAALTPTRDFHLTFRSYTSRIAVNLPILCIPDGCTQLTRLNV